MKKLLIVVLVLAVVAGVAYGQSAPTQMLTQYRALRNSWFVAASAAANRLFTLLAVIEVAWVATLMVLEKTDLMGFTATFVRKLLTIWFFFMLLQFGPTWIPAIIHSLEMVGENAAAAPGGLSPGAVFVRGLEIAGNLLTGASGAGFLTNFGTAMALVAAAVLTFLAFCFVSIQYVVALVESYIVIGAGFIFLGFGGSRWTASYVERYIGLAIAVGIKIMCLYLLIGAGMLLSNGWLVAATNISGMAQPALGALDILGSSLIFLAICWQAPKMISGVLGGSPSLTGGDLVSTGATVALGGAAAFATAAGGAAMLAKMAAGKLGAMAASQAAGLGARGGSKGGGGGAGTPGGGGGGTGGKGGGGMPPGNNGSAQPNPPPAKSAAPPGGAAPETKQPDPPAAGKADRVAKFADSSAKALGKGATNINRARYAIPSDAAPPVTPPPLHGGGSEGDA